MKFLIIVLILINLQPEIFAEDLSITVENTGNNTIHFSYENDKGEIIGLFLKKGQTKLHINEPVRITFDHLQELYPFILFPNDLIKVNLNSQGIFVFDIPDKPQHELYRELEVKTHILKSPFSGIDYNKKTNYDLVLAEIKNTRNKRFSMLNKNFLGPNYYQLYQEIIFARYVDELQAPFHKLGYGSNIVPNSYLVELEGVIDFLVKLVKTSSRGSLYRHYLLTCVKTKLIKSKNQSNELYYDYVEKYFSGNLKYYLQFQILNKAQKNGENVDYLIDRYLKNNIDESYKSYFLGIKKITDLVSTNKIDLLTTIDGDMRTWNEVMRNYKHKIIYLDIWASWCAPCRAEMPYSINLQKQLENHGVEIIYISIDSNIDKWKKAVSQYFSGSSLIRHYKLNPDTDLAELLTRGSVPKYLIVDKSGNLISINASRPSQSDTFGLLVEMSKSK